LHPLTNANEEDIDKFLKINEKKGSKNRTSSNPADSRSRDR